MLQKLESFHHRCVRTLTGTNLWNAREQHVKTVTLLERLGVRSLKYYVHRRTLRWLGHVARMPFDRLPRKMLTAWVHAPRHRGQKTLYYGSFVLKCLERAGIDEASWFKLAQNRDTWRKTLNEMKL
jgi:hypothetical protein